MTGSQKVLHSTRDSRLVKDVPEQVELYIIMVRQDSCRAIDHRIHAHDEKQKRIQRNRICFTD